MRAQWEDGRPAGRPEPRARRGPRHPVAAQPGRLGAELDARIRAEFPGLVAGDAVWAEAEGDA